MGKFGTVLLLIVIGTTAASGDCPREWALGFHAPGIAGVWAQVYALTTFDDGSGPALYVGGDFNAAGDAPGSAHIAKWDGMRWSALPGLATNVFALAVFDDGTGPAIYVTGDFTGSYDGTVALPYFAKWDGQEWLPVEFPTGEARYVSSRYLCAADTTEGPRLYAVRAQDMVVFDGVEWAAVAQITGVVGIAHGRELGEDRLYVTGDLLFIGSTSIHSWNCCS